MRVRVRVTVRVIMRVRVRVKVPSFKLPESTVRVLGY